jgi:ATP-dependent RNA helicase RhlE
LKFTAFGFNPDLLQGIEALGFEEATPVQEQAIPAILENRDILASAQTGTGKTAAFLLPIIQKIITQKHKAHHIKALIIVPTRELAIQIDQNMEALSYFTHVTSIAVYGGSDGSLFSNEKKALSEGTDIVICTPGRMKSHLTMKYVDMSNLQYLVLDEADRMLDMGFHPDIMQIISYLPEKRQNLLFSATMPKNMGELTKEILHNPVKISIAASKPAEKILQFAYIVYETQKIPLIGHILSSKKKVRAIVFCSTKKSAKELTHALKQDGLAVSDIHSDYEQETRKVLMNDFRNHKINILIATDLLSRGIDIEDIELIINFDVPNDGEDYIHRIGRTARAESDGVAITLVSEQEQGKFADIEKLLDKTVNKAPLPAHLGTGPEYEPTKHKFRKFKRRRN